MATATVLSLLFLNLIVGILAFSYRTYEESTQKGTRDLGNFLKFTKEITLEGIQSLKKWVSKESQKKGFVLQETIVAKTFVVFFGFIVGSLILLLGGFLFLLLKPNKKIKTK
jgi:preprotein translocase subunit YajC